MICCREKFVILQFKSDHKSDIRPNKREETQLTSHGTNTKC